MWNGFGNADIIKNLSKNTDWLTTTTSETLDQIDTYSKNYTNLIAFINNFSNQIENFKYKTIIYPDIDNQDLTIKKTPHYFKVN
jgi:hypothetical protein